MESLVSIAGETITKIGISVSKSPIRGKDANDVGYEEKEVERYRGGVERRYGKGEGKGESVDDVRRGSDKAGEHDGNGRESSAARKGQEPQDGERNPETGLSPGGKNFHLVSPDGGECWEEGETKASGSKRKCCIGRSPIERGRTAERKVNGKNSARVQRSSNRCLIRKAFDNITRAVASARSHKLSLIFYDDATGIPSSSDEGYTEKCDRKECHDTHYTPTRQGQDVEPVPLKAEAEQSLETGRTLRRSSEKMHLRTSNDSILEPVEVDSDSLHHRVCRRKIRSKDPDIDSRGSRRGLRSRTFSDRILMRSVVSTAEQKRRTTRMRTKRANCVARKSLRTITLILGAFVLCWTPWHVLSLIMGFCSGYMPACVPSDLYDVSYWLCYLNSCINPFCYALANQQFKKAFLRILRFDWRRT